MTTIQKVGVVVAGLLALLGGLSFFGFHLGGGSAAFGSSAFSSGQVQTNPMLFVNGFSAGSSQQFYVDGNGNIANGLTLTTSNTATSTLKVGCIQMYATSTATAVHLEFSTTTSLATYSGGSIPTGGVSWRYGTCPV